MDFRQFIEAKLGSYTYALPRDKEKQLYDFYMLSALKGSGDPDIKEAIRYTREKLLPSLKEELLKAIFFALMSEFRHAGHNYDEGHWGSWEMDKMGPHEDLFKKYLKRWRRYWNRPQDIPQSAYDMHREDVARMASYAAATDVAPRWQMVKLARLVFDKLPWEPGYGGKAWAKIASGWLKLNNAKNDRDMQVWIDHVYDLQHNSDTVFNKLREYYKNAGHGWIRRALNYKAAIKSPWEIFDKTSENMQRLASFAMKGAFPAYRMKRGEAQYATKQGWEEFGEHQYYAGGKTIRLTPQQVRKVLDEIRRTNADQYALKMYKYEGLNHSDTEDLIASILQKNDIPGDEAYRMGFNRFAMLRDADMANFIRENQLMKKREELGFGKSPAHLIVSDIQKLGGVSSSYARRVYEKVARDLGMF